MKYRNLGKQGLKVSDVSIGTMYHGSYYGKKQSFGLLQEAINQGINYIDCADRYGIFDSELPMEERTPAEEYLGEFLQGQSRDDLVISTKVFYKMRENPNSGGLSRKHIHEAVKRSLKLLQTDYIDIYYCHRPDRDTQLEETILTMSDLIDEGTIHHWGTSWWPPTMVERAIWIAKRLGAHPPHAEQPPYHMYARFIEQDLVEVARFHGVGLITFEALATGLITDRYLKGTPEDSRASRFDNYTEELMERYQNRISKLAPIAKELDVPLNQMAIAWTLRLPEVSSSLMGASKPKHVVSNAQASEVTLSKDIIEKIEEALNES